MKKNISFSHIEIALGAYILYTIGVAFKKFNTLNYVRNNCVITFTTCTLVLLVCNDYGRIEMVSCTYTSFYFYLTSSIFGFGLLYSLSVLITNHKFDLLSSFLVYCGKNTIWIIAIHFFAFKIITYIEIEYYSLPMTNLSAFPILEARPYWWLLYAITGVFSPLLLKKLFDNIYKHLHFKIHG